jgi:hypothetical protein
MSVREDGLHRWVVVAQPHSDREHEFLRLFNPTADVAEVRISAPPNTVTIEPGAILDREIHGSIFFESTTELIGTARRLEEDPFPEADAQLIVAPLGAGTKANDVACPPIAILTPASACRFGTSGAAVEAIPGASYTWAVEGAAITGGDGTNRINLAFGSASGVSLAVTVRTQDGCTRTGAATVALHDPFRLASLFSPSVTLGDPVTISWAIAGTDIPRSQTLTINGASVKTAIGDRNYTFTPAALGTYTVRLDASLVGGKRRACCRSVDVPSASFCGLDSRTTSFTVTPPCTSAAGSIRFTGSSIVLGQTTPVAITANASWSLRSAQGNPLSTTSGTGDTTVTFTGSVLGTDILTLTIFGECGTVTRTDTITVTAPPTPPTVTITADSTSLGGGGITTLRITIGNAPDTSQTTYTITSSRGNSIFPASGTGSGSKTASYGRDNWGGDDTVTVTVIAPNGMASATCTIGDAFAVPRVTITADSTTVGLGGGTTLRITISDASDTSETTYTITSSKGNSIFPASGTGSGSKTASYGRDNSGGDDTVTVTVTSHGQTASASIVIH